MTKEDQARLREMDDLLDRIDSLTPAEAARLEELGDWNVAEMKRLGLPIEELLTDLCDLQLSDEDDNWTAAKGAP